MEYSCIIAYKYIYIYVQLCIYMCTYHIAVALVLDAIELACSFGRRPGGGSRAREHWLAMGSCPWVAAHG